MLNLLGCSTSIDTSAAHLVLEFTARVVDANSWTATAAFRSAKGRVFFTKGEQVTCAGHPLTYDAAKGIFTQNLAIQSHGTTYTCAYITGQETSSWSVTLPDPVQVVAPLPNALVDRQNVTVHYTGATAGNYIEVVADNGANTSSRFFNNESSDTSGVFQFPIAPDPTPHVGTGRLSISSAHDEVYDDSLQFAGWRISDYGMVTVIPVTWT